MGSWLRTHAALIGAALLCVLHFTSFHVARQPLVTDVRYFVYFAWRVSEGAVPHLDYYENKTQLATFVGGALFRGSASLARRGLTDRLTKIASTVEVACHPGSLIRPCPR